jgi:hypothetical protein
MISDTDRECHRQFGGSVTSRIKRQTACNLGGLIDLLDIGPFEW